MKALISVSDKTGLTEFASQLSALGVEIISTGGTAQALQQSKIPTQEVSEFTGFPEILGGRVKTLHPKIFGGILSSRNNPRHQSEIADHSIPLIDWVIVNLYPFEKIHMENKLPTSEMIEFIDIGGVSLLRAAAKNFTDVVVICDPADYPKVIAEFKENKSVSIRTRRLLAGKVFAHTAHYDSIIAKFFSRADVLFSTAEKPITKADQEQVFPNEFTIGLRKVCDLRYGENPQQKASLYRESGHREWGVVNAEKIQGKELSFNNYLDLDNAWQIVNALASRKQGKAQALSTGYNNVCCVIIKHTNPCGAAIARNAQEAFQMAMASDPLSAFGGIVGFSATVDEETAVLMTQTFFECVIAPDFTSGALERFKKKPNVRLLRQKTILSIPYELDLKKVSGGLLVQERDLLSDGQEPVQAQQGVEPEEPKTGELVSENRKIVTKRTPTAEEVYALEFAWKICKYVKSNAIVLARGAMTQGVGAGQMSRIDSLKIAIQKMRESKSNLVPSGSLASAGPLSQMASMPLVLASDAFFPFRDCVDEAAKAGVSAIIVPGGSLRDAESIQSANEHNIAMIFTGIRHFRH